MMTARLSLLVVAATISCAAAAHAQTLDFSFVGDTTASWTQTSNPTPIFNISNVYTDVPVTNGFSGTANFGDVVFYTYPASLGGFVISAGNFTLRENGPLQIFTGPVDNPMFSPGEYDLPNGRLSVTAVPEPLSWALLLVGLAGVSVALRRRRKGAAPVPVA